MNVLDKSYPKDLVRMRQVQVISETGPGPVFECTKSAEFVWY